MLNRLGRTLSTDWPRFLIELVIVVGGISISFWLQDWREATRASSEEARILRTIKSDLEADQLSLERYLEMLRVGRGQLSKLLETDGLEGRELDVAMDQAISYAFFAPVAVGWNELQQSGGSLIRDKKLLGELITLHSQRYAACDEWGDINRDFILQRMIPYIDEHGPFVDGAFEGGIAGGMGAIHKELVPNVQFRNLIRTNRLFREGQAAVYTLAVKQLQAVKKLVEEALGELD